MTIIDRRTALGGAALLGAGAFGGFGRPAQAATLNEALAGYLTGLHDPVMIKEKGVAVIVERPWASTRWRGPGHCGPYRDGARDLIVYHAHDAEEESKPTLRLAELRWDAEGWPTALT